MAGDYVMITKDVTVTATVRVTIDETKFTPEVFAEFDKMIEPFGDDLDEHMKRLGWLCLMRGMESHHFFEGLGTGKGFGIKFEEMPGDEIEIAEVRP